MVVLFRDKERTLVYDFDKRKYWLLNDLWVSKNNLALFNKCLRFGKEWNETIELELEYFKQTTQDLIQLKKDKRNGLFTEEG